MANSPEQETQHALLVVWGPFAREIGLISGLEAVKLNQKTYEHSPQSKVLEFLVAILSGAKYLQEISLAAHPLDKDVTLAQAWGQTGWADFSGGEPHVEQAELDRSTGLGGSSRAGQPTLSRSRIEPAGSSGSDTARRW